MGIDRDGRSIVDFLDRHRLAHTPANYAFGWRFLNAGDTPFHDNVRSIADDGIRLTQSLVDRLMPPLRSDSATIGTSLDTIATDIMAIITDATREAGTFSRDLTLAAADLVSSDGSKVHAVVATMLAQAERAEARLVEMSRQTSTVRAQLLALGREGNPVTSLLSQCEAEAAITTALDGRRQVVMAIICVNQLTSIGASYGIGVAERVLCAVGQAACERCTPHRVGRWKGKSLVAIFEDTTVASAQALLDGIRGDLAGRTLKLRENDEPLGIVTFSAALAALEDRRGKHVDRVFDLLLDTASSLRNRVTVIVPE